MKTLSKLLREQATADAETQAIEQQRCIWSEGARQPKTVGTNKSKSIPITQDDDDGDETLAPKELDLPFEDWDASEDDEATPP